MSLLFMAAGNKMLILYFYDMCNCLVIAKYGFASCSFKLIITFSSGLAIQKKPKTFTSIDYCRKKLESRRGKSSVDRTEDLINVHIHLKIWSTASTNYKGNIYIFIWKMSS